MNKRYPTKQRCARVRRAGFTLLEVMLAVLVLGASLVALTRMLILGRLSSDADAKRVVALSILRREADLVQARGHDSLVSEPATSVPDSTVSPAGSCRIDTPSNRAVQLLLRWPATRILHKSGAFMARRVFIDSQSIECHTFPSRHHLCLI